MKLKRYWPWPKNLYVGKRKSKFGIGKTSKGWAIYRKRLKRIYPVHHYLQKIKDWLTQYPFNRYGIRDLKYWFIYRLSKKHKYHILDTGLKPGYYEFDEVIDKAISGKRFLEIFEMVYEQFQRNESEKAYDGSDIHTEIYKTEMAELKIAYDWFKTGRPAKEKENQELLDSLPQRPRGMDIMEWLGTDREQSKEIYDKSNQIDAEIHTTTTENLIRIVKYRGYLWT